MKAKQQEGDTTEQKLKSTIELNDIWLENEKVKAVEMLVER